MSDQSYNWGWQIPKYLKGATFDDLIGDYVDMHAAPNGGIPQRLDMGRVMAGLPYLMDTPQARDASDRKELNRQAEESMFGFR